MNRYLSIERALRAMAACSLLVACGSDTTDLQDDAQPAPPDVRDEASSILDAASETGEPPNDTAAPPFDSSTDTRSPPVVTDARDASDTRVDTAPSGDASSIGVPVLAVDKITGATSAELPMIREGVALANETMKTACFKAYVLSARWTETNGLSQAQIWDKLCSAVMTVDADMYTGTWYQNNVSHTIGYEDQPGLVHMNRYFVDTAYMVADNLIHEAEGHSQGFSHYGVKSTSVPYGLNAAFEACSPVKP